MFVKSGLKVLVLLLVQERMGPTIMAKLLLDILLWAECFDTADKCLMKKRKVDLMMFFNIAKIVYRFGLSKIPAWNIHST